MKLYNYLLKTNGNLEYFFKLIEYSSDISTSHIVVDTYCATVIYSECQISKLSVTCQIFFQIGISSEELEIEFITTKNYSEAEQNMIEKFSIYLILRRFEHKYSNVFIRECLKKYNLLKDNFQKKQNEMRLQTLDFLKEKEESNIYKSNTIAKAKENPKKDKTLIKLLNELFKSKNQKDPSKYVGLSLSLVDEANNDINNFNFEIFPVIILQEKGKRKIKLFLNSKESVDLKGDLELIRYINVLQSIVYNGSQVCRLNKKLIPLISDSIWSYFIHSNPEDRFIKIKNTYYPFIYQECDNLNITFKCLDENENKWGYKLLFLNENNEYSNLNYDEIFLAQSLQHFCLLKLQNKQIQLIELTNEKIKSFIYKLFNTNYYSLQEIEYLINLPENKIPNLEFTIVDEEIISLQAKPVPCLFVEKQKYNYRVIPFFDYNPEKVRDIDQNLKINYHIINKKFEDNCLQYIDQSDFLTRHPYGEESKIKMYFTAPFYHKTHYSYIIFESDFNRWMQTEAVDFIENGFEIFTQFDLKFYKRQVYSLDFRIKMTNNWFEFKPVLYDTLNQESFDISSIDPDLLIIKDNNDNVHQITKEIISKLKEFEQYAQKTKDGYRIPSSNPLILNALDEKIKSRPEFLSIKRDYEKMKSFDKISEYSMAQNFNGTLRNYQKSGYNWLRFLNEFKFNGCLADDMGLGKTVQTLALLQCLKENNQLNTSLLVVPLSSIPNWQDEMEKFTPDLTYFCIHGKNNIQSAELKKYDIIIGSYATIRQKINDISDLHFDYLILDESQNIKNHTTMTAQVIKTITSNHRLALSGTPIENNLAELWSLFDFLSPGYLGKIDYFKDKFINPITKDKNAEIAETLKKAIFPFILRRKKQDVEIDLPEKNEIIVHVDMDLELEKLYNQVAKSFQDSISQQLESEGIHKTANKIFEGMLRLRQLCLFPELVNPNYNVIDSPKFSFLKDLLEDLLREDHKILIFSQFTGVLDIIETYITFSSINFCRIDGSTTLKQREKSIKEFQNNSEIQVFLLSLKSGGVALNLTAADYVVIFDPWWNPAVEAQAIDRAHRIGQTRKVFSYRIIVRNSIEDKIMKLKEAKKELMDSLITEDSSLFKSLSKEELLNLFT